MTDITPADLRSRIAAEFDRRGWPYEPDTAQRLLSGSSPGESIDATALAARLPADYLDRNGIDRDLLAAALADLGGLTLAAVPASQAVTITINDERYQVNMLGKAKIEGSNLNLGGTQVNVDVDVDASRSEVLAGAEALVRAGLGGEWDPAAAEALAAVVDERGDISAADLNELTREVATAERADPGRIRAFLEQVALSAASSKVASGITSGLAYLLANPPF
jgi:hypothetical protein